MRKVVCFAIRKRGRTHEAPLIDDGFFICAVAHFLGESQLNRSLAGGCNRDYNSRVSARILLLVAFTAVLLMSRSQPGVSTSAASGDDPCRSQIAAHGPAPHNGIVMNGIDVLEQDGFREVRGSDPSSHVQSVLSPTTPVSMSRTAGRSISSPKRPASSSWRYSAPNTA
jgi:hypothetical protein